MQKRKKHGYAECLLVLLNRTKAVGAWTKVAAAIGPAVCITACRGCRNYRIFLEIIMTSRVGCCVAGMHRVASPAVGHLAVVPFKRIGDAIAARGFHHTLATA